jgi:hypothetical protein
LVITSSLFHLSCICTKANRKSPINIALQNIFLFYTD